MARRAEVVVPAGGRALAAGGRATDVDRVGGAHGSEVGVHYTTGSVVHPVGAAGRGALSLRAWFARAGCDRSARPARPVRRGARARTPAGAPAAESLRVGDVVAWLCGCGGDIGLETLPTGSNCASPENAGGVAGDRLERCHRLLFTPLGSCVSPACIPRPGSPCGG